MSLGRLIVAILRNFAARNCCKGRRYRQSSVQNPLQSRTGLATAGRFSRCTPESRPCCCLGCQYPGKPKHESASATHQRQGRKEVVSNSLRHYTPKEQSGFTVHNKVATGVGSLSAATAPAARRCWQQSAAPMRAAYWAGNSRHRTSPAAVRLPTARLAPSPRRPRRSACRRQDGRRARSRPSARRSGGCLLPSRASSAIIIAARRSPTAGLSTFAVSSQSSRLAVFFVTSTRAELRLWRQS